MRIPNAGASGHVAPGDEPSVRERGFPEYELGALAALVTVSRDRKAPWERVTDIANSLIRSALASGNWEALDKLLSETFEYADPEKAPGLDDREETAQSGKYAERVRLPEWIRAYVRIFLSQKKAVTLYAQKRPAYLSDPDFLSFYDRIRELPRKEGGTSVPKRALAVKFLLDAARLLEREISESAPIVTRTPAFFLLLNVYETLHAVGVRPEFANSGLVNASYFDLVQLLLERFPAEDFPDVYEYLAEYRLSHDEADYLSVLTSRIETEGEMDRIVENGKIRQRAIDATMRRVRSAVPGPHS